MALSRSLAWPGLQLATLLRASDEDRERNLAGGRRATVAGDRVELIRVQSDWVRIDRSVAAKRPERAALNFISAG